MTNRQTVSVQERHKLIERIKTDPKFRDRLKENWVDAFKEAGINPAEVKGRVLDHRETSPFAGGPAMSGITITITIFAAAGEERIDLGDIVTFDAKRT